MPDDRRPTLAKLQQEFGKPIIALPPGQGIEGHVVRIERQPELLRGSGRPPADLAVVDAKHHLSIISVPPGSADHYLGQSVRLRNEHGQMTLTLARRQAELER